MTRRVLARLMAPVLAVGLGVYGLVLCCCALDAGPAEASLSAGCCCPHASSDDACGGARLVAPVSLEHGATPQALVAASIVDSRVVARQTLPYPSARFVPAPCSPSPRITILRV